MSNSSRHCYKESQLILKLHQGKIQSKTNSDCLEEGELLKVMQDGELR